MKTSILLSIAVFFILQNVSARADTPVNLQPGLWLIQTTDAKTGENSAVETKEVIDGLSPANQKLAKSKMAKAGVGYSDNGIKICYTKQMLDDQTFARPPKVDVQCVNEITKTSETELAMNFNCQDGAKGNSVWKMPNPKVMDGTISMSEKDGKNSKTLTHGKFIADNCGNVKPIDLNVIKPAKN